MVFVEQASRDDDQDPSLRQAIQQLEQNNLYDLLCRMHVDFNAQNIPWNSEISRDLMELTCRVLDHQAPVDNRNYMVFYTLKRLLDHMTIQFRRIGKRLY